jgi:ABC-type transport system involved in multi-copper enzyme maturation permease subunit
MDDVIAIARTTYWKHARSKALYLLWLLVIALIVTANRYDVLSLGRHKILMTDIGLALIALVGACSVMVLGVEVPRELRQRIAENLLSKPLGRDQYLSGKFLGALLFALSNMVFVTIGYVIALVATKNEVSGSLLIPLLGVFGMVLILTSASALFGSFLSEVPAVIATFLVFWLGHSTQAVAKMADKMDGAGHMILRGIYGLLPNLNLLNSRGDFSQETFGHANVLSWNYTLASLGYAVLYAAVLFVAALYTFRKRDL